jgi:hypothetical protein
MLWIPANFVTFRFVPLRFQVLFANVIALGWNAYLSWATHHSLDTEGPSSLDIVEIKAAPK